VIWNVNSTAKGGGVVEMLRPLLGYCRGAGVDARWAVISGAPDFFAITKRIHNRLHGFAGDGGPLGDAEREVYEETLAASARELVELVRPEDIVILHDPQTAGLAAAIRATGATVMWRCHVGLDAANEHAREAWNFLRGHVLNAHVFIFSRAGFAWEGLPRDHVSVIRPSIDAFAPKNAEQTPEQALAILATAGVLAAEVDAYPAFIRSDGTPGRVQRRAEMLEEAPLTPDVPVVMQVSRWDQLKDPLGVLGAFADHVAGRSDAHLLLVGRRLRRCRRPGGRAGPGRGPGGVARAAGLSPPARAPVLAADGRHRGERRDRQRPAAARGRGRAERASRRASVDRGRGDVEAAAGRGQSHRRDPRPDRARPLGSAAAGPARPLPGRRGGNRAARRRRAPAADRGRGAAPRSAAVSSARTTSGATSR
jgi:hypothetical protein